MARWYGESVADVYTGSSTDDYINGEGGNDTLDGADGNDTMVGGTGSDYLTGGDGADIFVYNTGDGNDRILDYENEDLIQVNGTVSKVAASGNNVIMTIGSGKISVIGGKDKVITYTDDTGTHTYPNVVEFSNDGKGATLLSAYSQDSFDINDYEEYAESVLTIDASAVTNDLAITANLKSNQIIGTEENDYIDGGSGKDTILGGDGNDTIEGGKGNDSLIGGNGADVFVYNSGDGNDIIVDYKNEDIISLTSGEVTAANIQGDDYIFSIGGSKLSVLGGAASKKYVHFVNAYGEDVWYPEAPPAPVEIALDGKAVTLTEGFTDESFDPETYEGLSNFVDTVVTIDGSAVLREVAITGTAKANRIIGSDQDDYIDGGSGADTILGGDGNDSIEGGDGNDSLVGGAGADTFIYSAGDGNDRILDYENEDSIVIDGKVSTIKTSGNNVILTVGSNKISVIGGKDKVITYTDDTGTYNYPQVVNFSADGKGATLLSAYAQDSFDINDYEEYADTVVTVDASAVEHSIAITGNAKANRIIATEQDDYIDGGAGADTILGGDGNDSIEGGKGNDSLSGGNGADTFIYTAGDGNDRIIDYENEDSIVIDGTVSNIKTSGNNVILTVGSNKISLIGGKDKVITYIDDNGEHFYPRVPIDIETKGATLLSGYAQSSFNINDYENYADSVLTIDGSAVTHSLDITGNGNANRIIGTEEDDYIEGGAGKDSILGGDGNDTLSGGAGNDSLLGGDGNDTIIGGAGSDTLNGGDGADTFVYTTGDGNDRIVDYTDEDSILVNGTVSTVKASGNNVILTVGSGKISVIGGKDKVITYTDDTGTYTYPQVVNFNSAGTGATLLSGYAQSSFDINTYENYADSVVTIDASAVEHSIAITGNAKSNRIIATEQDDYIDGGAGADTILGGDGNDSIEGGKGNDSLVGGDGADTFIYNSGDGNDRIVDYTDEDSIVVNGTVSTVKASGNNVILTVGSNKISVIGGKDKVITYTDDTGTYTYPQVVNFNSAGTGATLLSGYTQSSFDINTYENYADSVVTIDGSAVEHSIAITGNAKSNRIIATEQDDYIDGGSGADTILGGDGNDSIEGGKGNDSLVGGDGADTFIYTAGDGNDRIVDYTDEDSILVNGTVSNIKASGNNVIMTVGSNKISVIGGKDKVITYTDDSGTYPYPQVVNFNSAGTGATILSGYTQDSFDINDYENYADSVVTIDASAVEHELAITANGKANRVIGTEQNDYINGGAGADTILGGDGNDSIEGGKGNDSLVGGDGADTFIYNDGDGNDRIVDYEEEDIIVVNGTVSTIKNSGNNVIMTVGTGKISVIGGKDKTITYIDDTGIHPESPIEIDGEVVTIFNNYKNDTFDVGDYEGSLKTINASAVTHGIEIIGNAQNNLIIGGTSNDYLHGLAGKDTLNGGEGNDTLDGGSGNDTLIGGDGADTFLYAAGAGNDVIADYTNSDEILITGTVSTITTSGNDAIFTVGRTKLTVKGGAQDNIVINYTDDEGSHTYPEVPFVISEDGTEITLTEKYTDSTFNVTTNSQVTAYANTILKIDASAIEQDIALTGNAKANSIISGSGDDSVNGAAGNDLLSGEEGDDTLIGGKGNDTLYGGSGNDTFYYASGDGNDVIVDYEDDEIIRVNGNVGGNAEISGNDVIFTVGSGKITVKDRAGTAITYVDNNGTTNHYYYDPLIADDNYSMDAASLSDIVKPASASYTPYDFEASLNLTKEENFAPEITYSKEK